jgi:hypothetical protein
VRTPQLTRDAQAILARHVDVEQDEVGRLEREKAPERWTAICLTDAEALALKVAPDHRANARFVVDDDEVCRRAHAQSPAPAVPNL